MVAIRIILGFVVIVGMLAGCASPPAPRASEGAPGNPQGQPQAPRTPKRITAAVRSNPVSLIQTKTQQQVGRVQGLDAIEEAVHAGLTHRNDQGVVLPQLAEAVPTIENGGWKVESDGRMQTTWKI